MAGKHRWSELSTLQLGQYAEYYVKMEFTLHDFDVYSAEVDDKGIDFVIRRHQDLYYDVQVKSSRNLSYVFFPKETFAPCAYLLAALVLFDDEHSPSLYLISSTAWLNLNPLFVSRDYVGKKSRPEWGLNLSRRNLPLLAPYAFEKTVEEL